MWRSLGWMMVVVLCGTAHVAAGKDTDATLQRAHALNELAWAYVAQNRIDEAIPLFMRAFTLSEEYLHQQALSLSEPQLMRLLRVLRADEERLYALLGVHPDHPRLRHLVLTVVLLLKGRSLDALEATRTRRSAPPHERTALPPPAAIVERVAASLPQDAALIELVAYEDRPLSPPRGPTVTELRAPLRYLALVLFPTERIEAVDLGLAAPIDSAASELRNALADKDAAYQRTAVTLYSLVFRPLLPRLGGVRRLSIAPDGQLGLISFDVLHDGRGELIESFDFSYLASGRDLLPRSQLMAPSRSVVVMADPSSATAPSTLASSQEWAHALAQRSAPMRFATPHLDPAANAWVPLPGTREEALSIQRLFPEAQLFLGSDATLERLFQLEAPAVLHIATHGFFDEGDSTSQRSADPLLRSGMLLAGARRATARDLSGLDLRGTELAVLSACETGRGEVALGQGVYGLRRALAIAGAETVVSSLWKVNDDTTRQLMERYYRNLLAGQGRAAALRDAMRTLRKQYPHPHYWAPFLSLGRDAPLRAFAPRLSGLSSPHLEQHPLRRELTRMNVCPRLL